MKWIGFYVYIENLEGGRKDNGTINRQLLSKLEAAWGGRKIVGRSRGISKILFLKGGKWRIVTDGAIPRSMSRGETLYRSFRVYANY